jgi:hypothetical protein
MECSRSGIRNYRTSNHDSSPFAGGWTRLCVYVVEGLLEPGDELN